MNALYFKAILKGFEMYLITVSRGLYCKGKNVTGAIAHEFDHVDLSGNMLIDPFDLVNISEIKLIETLHDSSIPSP